MAEGKIQRLKRTLNLKKNLTQTDIDWEIKLWLSLQAILDHKKLSEKEVAQATANLAEQFNETIKLAKFGSSEVIKTGYRALEIVYNDICKNVEFRDFLTIALKDAINECLFVERINHIRSPREMKEA